jgi:hypothetical protein
VSSHGLELPERHDLDHPGDFPDESPPGPFVATEAWERSLPPLVGFRQVAEDGGLAAGVLVQPLGRASACGDPGEDLPPVEVDELLGQVQGVEGQIL